MDENKKKAYIYLLHIVLVDIRSHTWLEVKWWNPFSWYLKVQKTKYAAELADLFHNLPDILSIDPQILDEDLFWNYIDDFRRKYPHELWDYREAFKQRLESLS